MRRNSFLLIVPVALLLLCSVVSFPVASFQSSALSKQILAPQSLQSSGTTLQQADSTPDHFAKTDFGVQAYDHMPASSLALSASVSPIYDEQLVMSFTQDFTGLAYNVTAVEQTGSDGYGPAYLLNGLTGSGFWYQVGLAWDWPDLGGGVNQGFAILYEAFDSTGNSVFPSPSGSGLSSLSGPINQGDTVLLKLSFSKGNVTFYAYDWNTGASASESYSAQGATTFVGTPNDVSDIHGFFTGLMTEQYHSAPYYGNSNLVVYSNSVVALTSAWMSIDEFNSNTSAVLFRSTTQSPVVYKNPSQLQYFSSNGATIASNALEFLTGEMPQISFTVSYAAKGENSINLLPPTFSFVSNGNRFTTQLGTTPSVYSVDPGTTWSISSSLSPGTDYERWQTNQTTSGYALSSMNMTFVYYHQYLVGFGFNVQGGGFGYQEPTLTYQANGSQASMQLNARTRSVWADAGTSWTVSNPLPGSNSTERWMASSSSGVASPKGNFSLVYYHQYGVSASFSVIGGGSGYSNPALVSTAYGSPFSSTLSQNGSTVWLDAGAPWSANGTLGGSSSLERWIAQSDFGTVSNHTIGLNYYHQFYVAVQSSGEGGYINLQSGWYNASTKITLTEKSASGWMPEGWLGTGPSSYSGNLSSVAITVSAPISETALFYPGVVLSSSGGGSIFYSFGSMGGAVSSGATKTVYVPPGVNITLEASPSTFLNQFDGWKGSASINQQTKSLTVNSPISITADFGYNYSVIALTSAAVIILVVVGLLAVLMRKHSTP